MANLLKSILPTLHTVLPVKPKLTRMPPGFRKVLNRTIHVATIPGFKKNGPTVFLIHGLAANALSWLPLIRQLIKRASKFVIFDLPGHGLSPVPEDTFTVLDAYRTVEAFLIREIEPDENTILIGNSLGGAFTLRFVLDHPDVVNKATLISPAGVPFPETAAAVLSPFIVNSLSDARRIARMIFVHSPLTADIASPQIYQTAIQPSFKSLVQSMLEYDTDPDSPGRAMLCNAEELQNCQVPLQLIWGQKDEVLPAGMRDFLDEHLPASCTRIFPETFGHCPQFDTVEALASLISLE